MKTTKHLNKFLNAHLQCQEDDILLSDVYATLTEHPELNPSYLGPFLYSDDASTPTPEQLARITWLFIDFPALRLGIISYLRDLPNLRELQIYAPGHPLNIYFLKNLPNLRLLHIECENIRHHRPFPKLKQLRHLVLNYRNPYVGNLNLPYLEYLYLHNAEFEQVQEFLEKHPNCQVDFVDEDFEVRWEARMSQGQPFRSFSLVKDDLLEIFIYPLIPADFSEDLSPARQQELLRAALPLCDEMVAEYRSSSNCILWQDHELVWDGFVFSYQFQWLMLESHREELEAIPRELRELLDKGFDANKIEWWLLKYGSFRNQLFYKWAVAKTPAREEDCPFRYHHSAEASFLDAYRKLELLINLWRRRGDWLVLRHELRNLQVKEFCNWYEVHRNNLQRELLDPLKILKEDEASKTLKLPLPGYHLDLDLPWPHFQAPLEVQKKIERML